MLLTGLSVDSAWLRKEYELEDSSVETPKLKSKEKRSWKKKTEHIKSVGQL